MTCAHQDEAFEWAMKHLGRDRRVEIWRDAHMVGQQLSSDSLPMSQDSRQLNMEFTTDRFNPLDY